MDFATVLRLLPVVVLAWLAFFFGRTLRRGQVPLIEQIARVGDPQMPDPLRHYTRRLTGIWATYFVCAALVILLVGSAPGVAGLWVWLGTVVLFVGEHRLRPRFFPGRPFPSLVQQVRDTWTVWHPRTGRRG